MAYLGFWATLVSGFLVYWGLRCVALSIMRVADVLYLSHRDNEHNKAVSVPQVFRRTGTG